MSRRNFFVPPVVLDGASDLPLNRQIYRQIEQAFHDGAIPRGARLPSTRALAKILNVSRNTVLAAYGDLAADGLIRGEGRSGMRAIAGSAVAAPTLFGLHRVIRAAGYPARVLTFADADGNPLYIRY